MRVVAWNSAAQLRDRQQDIRAVGETLQVANVLTGSVRTADGQLRVCAQLIETSTGVYLWSETYDRELHDIFTIQEEIARAIVRTLRVRLSAHYDTAPIARVDSNIDAYDLYLKGRYHWNKRTVEGLTRSVQFFNSAIALDERSALAHAGLADAYSLLAEYGIQMPGEVMPKARAAAQRALELDSGLAEAWTSLALIRSVYDWEWEEAGRLYRHAITLNAGYVTAHHWLGLDYYAMLGRFNEALECLETALSLDPLSELLLEGKTHLLILRRHYEKAAEHGRAVAESAPRFFKAWTSLGRAYAQMGQYDLAIECFERGRSLAGEVPSILAALGHAHALAGRTEECRRILAEVQQIALSRYVPATCRALLHSALDETDCALACLEVGCENRELPMISLKIHPVYDPLRPEPRFQRILRKMRMTD